MKNLKIAKIQQKLKDKKIDSLIINRTDEFLNEYIPPDAERLYWATNFSGSAGRAIICQNSSNLFVDGRYTFQAKAQIDENAISLLHWNDFSTEISKHFETKFSDLLFNLQSFIKASKSSPGDPILSQNIGNMGIFGHVKSQGKRTDLGRVMAKIKNKQFIGLNVYAFFSLPTFGL